MKPGSKVFVFLTRDAEGFGPAISDALQPNPNSSYIRTETSFDLSLERYGIKNKKASGNIVNFVDSQGSNQVSVLLLQKYEPPVAACVVKEVLESIIMGENSSDLPALVLPFIVAAQKINRERTNPTLTDQKITIYGTQMGHTTDFTKSMIAGIPNPPPSLAISCQLSTCLVQLIHVLELPTVVLIGSSNHPQKTIDQDLEALYGVGEFLASYLGLCFSKDKICSTLKENKERRRAMACLVWLIFW